MSPKLAAKLFAALIAGVVAFQLALALGAPLGEYAMGGAARGAFPPALRVAAVAQGGVLVAAALIVLSRASVALPRWRAGAGGLAWAVVALLGVAVVLNLITPSAKERLAWAPVAVALFGLSLRVALGR